MKRQKEKLVVHVHLHLALSMQQTSCLDIGLCFVLQTEGDECTFSRSSSVSHAKMLKLTDLGCPLPLC